MSLSKEERCIYNKQWREKNPEKVKEIARRSYLKIRNDPEKWKLEKERSKEYFKKRYAEDEEFRERWNKYNIERQREYNRKHPEKMKKALERLSTPGFLMCGMIKRHEEELKDDPERLTPEFLQSLTGISCKNVVKQVAKEKELLGE